MQEKKKLGFRLTYRQWNDFTDLVLLKNSIQIYELQNYYVFILMWYAVVVM